MNSNELITKIFKNWRGNQKPENQKITSLMNKMSKRSNGGEDDIINESTIVLKLAFMTFAFSERELHQMFMTFYNEID